MSDPGDDMAGVWRALENQLQGVLGVSARRLVGEGPDRGPVAYRSIERFPAASTIKVFILQTLLERVAEGNARLDEELVLRAEDRVTGSGVLKSLSADRAYTLLDLATLMIVVSDNTATNLLIGRLGVEAINAVAADHGWAASRLVGLLQRPDLRREGDTSVSTTSPRDLADYFTALWQGRLLPAELTDVAQGIYRAQQRTDKLGRFLPFDRYSTETGDSDLVIASKSGSIRGVRNDAGVVEAGASSYVLAVMTRGCPDERFHPDNVGGLVVSRVSQALFERFMTTTG
jgi:beta-lactamase class A